ncbi:MAG: hypothetical protein ACRCXZ_02470 [Patescibacteria group bacterium]
MSQLTIDFGQQDHPDFEPKMRIAYFVSLYPELHISTTWHYLNNRYFTIKTEIEQLAQFASIDGIKEAIVAKKGGKLFLQIPPVVFVRKGLHFYNILESLGLPTIDNSKGLNLVFKDSSGSHSISEICNTLIYPILVETYIGAKYDFSYEYIVRPGESLNSFNGEVYNIYTLQEIMIAGEQLELF